MAVSPRMILAGSSDIHQRCYKSISPSSTQHKHAPVRVESVVKSPGLAGSGHLPLYKGEAAEVAKTIALGRWPSYQKLWIDHADCYETISNSGPSTVQNQKSGSFDRRGRGAGPTNETHARATCADLHWHWGGHWCWNFLADGN